MNDLDEIKNKLDIVDFIEQYLPLKKAGRNYRGLCPFHSEKTPSLMVSPDKQIWHCFGCSTGGDVFGFLMKKEGLSFSEALIQLADRAGVEIRNRPTNLGERNRLLAMNELSAKFFERALADSQEGRQALNYLVNRGINRETINTFRLGYAPSGWQYLVKFLNRKGYHWDEIEKAGLGTRRSSGFGDKFRRRVMFPITNTADKVVGFTGRVLDAADQPKYLNSPETLAFNKSQVLYGLSINKSAIQQANIAVLVEGQIDVLSSYQAGVKNVIAASGTALTGDQLRLIRRYAESLILALDTDAAGQEAIKRVVNLASIEDLEIKAAILNEFKDPDECIIKAGPEKWQAIVQTAVPIIDFYISSAVQKYGLDSVAAKKKIVAEVLPIIAGLDNPVEKDQYLNKLAGSARINVASLYEAINKLAKAKTHRAIQLEEAVKTDRDQNWLEKSILGLLIYRPDYYTDHPAELAQIKWPAGFLENVYEQLKICYTDKEFLLDRIVSQLEYQYQINLLEMMMVIEEHYANMPEGDIAKELNFYINLLNQRNTKSAMALLRQEIAEAEAAGDSAKVQTLLEKFQNFK